MSYRIRLRHVCALFVVLLVGLAVACQSVPGQSQGPAGVSAGSYRDISAAELHSMLARKDFFLVDVHIPNEGHLAQTDARIPYNLIEQNLGTLPADKDARIVLYCRSGSMSKIAADRLVSLGYRNIFNLKEGMVGWQASGYPMEAN